ncbi:pleckstrin homology domain-containing family O member 1-A [Clupea harengus]|uniref:Pleckstrin homology domain-containing family O member 1-A n=1 Tax=Clupea harengus TaxID=7950 RepID=A0A6P3W330_CLUHA|nr:pleckstrin homology domain-containing family O member 1-A [Clupea harengus]
MKKSNGTKRGLQDANQLSSQPDKVGWIRKFCGRGIFREIWKNRFVMLKGDHLYIFEKEMKDDGKTHEVFDLAEYERSEELRKAKSRSKKNHSKFTLLRCRQPGNRTPNLVFLAVSPEEKESWINVLNTAIVRAKNRILDEVTIEEESLLAHPTRDRAKIPPGRRLPTRGHLMTVASTSSDGMLTLDLVDEEDVSSPEDEGAVWVKDFRVDLDKLAPGRPRSGTDVSKFRVAPAEGRVKTGSLPRGSEMSWSRPPPHVEGQTQTQVHTPAHARTPQPGKRALFQARSRCASMDDALSRGGDRRGGRRDVSSRGGAALAHSPTGHLQDLIAQRLQRTQELLAEIQEQDLPPRPRENSAHGRGMDSPRMRRLRGNDSPHSKGSGSPHSKSSDSPCLKGKDSPRSKAKDSPRVKGSKASHSKSVNSSRGKVTDSPDSRAPNSPHLRNLDFTHLKESDSPLSTGSNSPHSKGGGSPHLKRAEILRAASSPLLLRGVRDSPLREGVVVGGSEWEVRRAAAERLLQEAITSWREAKEVLQEVKQLQERQRKAEPAAAATAASASTTPKKQATPSHDSKPKEP